MVVLSPLGTTYVRFACAIHLDVERPKIASFNIPKSKLIRILFLKLQRVSELDSKPSALIEIDNREKGAKGHVSSALRSTRP